MMRITTLFALMLFFISGPLAAAELQSIAGVWKGNVHRNDPGDNFDVKLTIVSNDAKGETKIGTLSAPELNCVGDLYLVQKTATSVTAKVKLTTNAIEECIDNGTLILQPQGTQVLFLWSHKPEKVVIAGTLKKAN